MSEQLVKQDVVWVDSNEQLESLSEKWQSKNFLAVDTEFMRSDTYYPIAGLIQLNDGEANYLIDPTRITDFFPLADIFDNENSIIAIHSCSEDLEVFYHAVGCMPKTLLDTQVACAFVGYGFSVGYANAISIGLDVTLPKAETRSNWLARPLSRAQLSYAALDVEYLYQLTEKLIRSLNDNGRWSWVMEDCERIKASYRLNQISERMYLRIKSAWRLSRSELGILRLLSKWREEKAQIRDIPRNRIVKENTLIELAEKQPSHVSELRGIEGITERMIKSDGNTLIALVAEGCALEEDQLPDALLGPLSAQQNRQLKMLRAEVSTIAEKYDLPIEVLIKKKEYEHLLHAKTRGDLLILPENLKGWREEVVGQFLLERITNLPS